jgi:hypothetical protein
MFEDMKSIKLFVCSTDQLEQQLVALEESHSLIVARQSVILQELDRRQVARGDGCRNLSEWVASRLDLSPEHAATLVRASRRLAASFEVAKPKSASPGEGEARAERAEGVTLPAAITLPNPSLQGGEPSEPRTEDSLSSRM